MKKIIIVVADGRIASVLSREDIVVEVVDFDSCDESEQEELGNYIDECRETMKEVIC